MFSWLGTVSVHLGLGPPANTCAFHQSKVLSFFQQAACAYPNSHLFLPTQLRGKVRVWGNVKDCKEAKKGEDSWPSLEAV